MGAAAAAARDPRHGADVLFAPAYSAPLFAPAPDRRSPSTTCRSARTRSGSGAREGLRRRWTCRLAAANAATVLTDSAFSRDEIVRWLGVPPARVRVTPLGVSTRVRPPVAGPRDDAAPLVLCVGTQLNRRHLPDLVRAFAPLARADARARLVIVGENRTFPRQDPLAVARDLGLADGRRGPPLGVGRRAHAPCTAPPRRSRGSRPTRGSGCRRSRRWPPACPSSPTTRRWRARSTTPPPRLVPVGHVDAVTAALLAFATDPRRRDAHREAGRRQVARFDWTRTAQATLAALREAAA